MSILDDPGLGPDTRQDFRRNGKGTPYMRDEDGKWRLWRRPSSFGNILDDTSNLTDWQKRTIIVGAARSPEVMAEVSVMDFNDDKDEIRDKVEECLKAGKGLQRAVTGTAIHRMLDRVDANDGWKPAPQFAAAVQAYVDTLELYGLVPVDMEIPVVNWKHRTAGHADRRYRTTRNLVTPTGEIIPIGTILVADTKTGRSLEYASGTYACQLAAYVDSDRWDFDNDCAVPFDPPNYKDWALIVHVDWTDGRCDLYWCDMEQGRQGLELAEAVREWRRRTDLVTPAHPPLYPVGGIVEPVVIVEAEGPEIVIPLPTVDDASERLVDALAAPITYVVDVPDDDDDPRAAARAAHPSSAPGEVARTPLAPVPDPPATDELGTSDGATDDVAAPSTVLPDSAPERQPAVDLDAVRAWLRGRVGVIRERGGAPTDALLRYWPQGVPGLKYDNQTESMLDAISEALWRVEKEFSLPFPPADPREPPFVVSDRWAKPLEPKADDNTHTLRMEIDKHPRRQLLAEWSRLSLSNLDRGITDREALAHALYEFAMALGPEYSDVDVTTMLDGTLRSIGYPDGVEMLGHVPPEHAPLIMSAAFAITAGTFVLVYGEDGRPVVNVIK